MNSGVRAWVAALVATTAMLLLPAAALAISDDGNGGTSGSGTSGDTSTGGSYDDSGIHVHTGGEKHGPVLVGGGGGGDNNGSGNVYVKSPVQAPCAPGFDHYEIFDANGNRVGETCVPHGQQPNPNPPVNPIDLAWQASNSQPWPNLVVRANPSGGITGMTSWFWLGGGSANMPDASASAGGTTVTVRAVFQGSTWDFGDGGVARSSGIGQPYPQRSDVMHVYDTDSYGKPAGYPVTATLHYRVDYSINGGNWMTLGNKTKTFDLSYQVGQVQPQAGQP